MLRIAPVALALLALQGCTTLAVVFVDDGGDGDVPDATGDVMDGAPADTGPDCAFLDTGSVPGCQPFPQSGCDDAEACFVADRGGFVSGACFSAGPGNEGSICGANSDCAVSYACFNYFGTSQCMQYCRCDADCMPLGAASVCLPGLIPSANACSVPCDPLRPSLGCPTGSSCALVPVRIAGVTHYGTSCRMDGTHVRLGTCTHDTDCAAGLMCFHNTCAPYCDTAFGTSCPGATTCMGLNPPAVIGGVTYGACQ